MLSTYWEQSLIPLVLARLHRVKLRHLPRSSQSMLGPSMSMNLNPVSITSIWISELVGMIGGSPPREHGRTFRYAPLSSGTGVTLIKPVRKRDKAHRDFVCSQSCLICGRSPSDAHHLRFGQPRALGRKVSDEFTVPL